MRFKEYLMEETSPTVDYMFSASCSYKDLTDVSYLGKIIRSLKSTYGVNFNVKQEMQSSDFILFRLVDIPERFYSMRESDDLFNTLLSVIFGGDPNTTARTVKGLMISQGIPKKRLAGRNINVNIPPKTSSLKGIEIISTNPNVLIILPHNYVGGLLSVFDMDNPRVNFRIDVEFGQPPKGLVTAVKIVRDMIVDNKDKWDCQEELEKDKSTKPFASD
jgi:hypothetical protein